MEPQTIVINTHVAADGLCTAQYCAVGQVALLRLNGRLSAQTVAEFRSALWGTDSHPPVQRVVVDVRWATPPPTLRPLHLVGTDAGAPTALAFVVTDQQFLWAMMSVWAARKRGLRGEVFALPGEAFSWLERASPPSPHG